jgi:uncharacterized protein
VTIAVAGEPFSATPLAPSVLLPEAVAWITAAGERLGCLADRALWWPARRTLFLADVHLGKAASFRAAGIGIPGGHSRDDLERISRLVRAFDATHVVVLGDLVHNRDSYSAALNDAFAEFRAEHRDLTLTLVRGNHDASAGDPPSAWGFTCVDDPFAMGPFSCIHDPHSQPRAVVSEAATLDGFALCGHVHPAVRIGTRRESVNLPCFWLRRRQLVLPSFGSITGRFMVTMAKDESALVVTGKKIFLLPTAGAPISG